MKCDLNYIQPLNSYTPFQELYMSINSEKHGMHARGRRLPVRCSEKKGTGISAGQATFLNSCNAPAFDNAEIRSFLCKKICEVSYICIGRDVLGESS